MKQTLHPFWSLAAGALLAGAAMVAWPAAAAAQSLTIPRVTVPPRLTDFTDAETVPLAAGNLAAIDQLVQRTPNDGARVSENTTVLIGYDDRHLYAVFLCAGSPAAIRAHRVNRDRIPQDDDSIALHLDTFRDGRRLYGFQVNPVGVQVDGIYTEGQGWDLSFDTVWQAETAMLTNGYAVLLTIPFRSLRFPPADEHRWGLFVYRGLPRKNEEAFWPAYSIRYQGRLAYAAELLGVRSIRANQSAQLTPYATMRAEYDGTVGASTAEARAGLDVKLTPRENLVLDLTAHPDFSQVESDEPQTTVNRRFEVFFPERRPFFIENASYFETPLQVLFTRRVREPKFGARFSGKAGKYAVGALFADDAAEDQGDGRSFITAVRASRDLAADSHVGVIYTGRTSRAGANHAGGADGRWRFGRHVVAAAQVVGSRTEAGSSGAATAGRAYQARLDSGGLRYTSSVVYTDVSADFHTTMGFVPRTDIRDLTTVNAVTFRPSGSRLLAWGPSVSLGRLWNQRGEAADARARLDVSADFPRQTRVAIFHEAGEERLRAVDVPTLTATHRFAPHSTGATAATAPFSGLAVTVEYARGAAVNLNPAPGVAPELATSTAVAAALSVRPTPAFTIDTTYLWSQLADDGGLSAIFSSHLLRSRWNYQITRRFSARLIVSAERLFTDSTRSSLRGTRRLNADVLVTYFVQPGTALYVGLNTERHHLVSTADTRQVFVKMSYGLWR